jgi:7-keto-8-aminopelargonate synthetase-like enzyme
MFDQELRQRLEAIRRQGLGRQLRRVDSAQGPRLTINGGALLNFSSNDYLGLANAPALKEAACRAIQQYGAGAGASRLICGSLAPHHELEETLASFKGAEAALSFSSGYATALGVIGALLDKDSIIVLDKRVHACIVDAARQSGARLRVFAHNDLTELEDILKWAAQGRRPGAKTQSPADREPSASAPRALVVTESVFSMDGDQAPLRELAALKERYGAWLMVDEAHATGLYGPRRRGLAEALGVAGQVEIQMGTLGKAIGAAGGYVVGSRALIDYLVNRARTFIFSTAPVPAAVAAATAGIRLVQTADGARRCEVLWERVGQLRHELGRSLPRHGPPSAIVPVILGEEAKAVAAADSLRAQGLFVPAIRYPTVARGAARLRVTVTAAHTAADVTQLASALNPMLYSDS